MIFERGISFLYKLPKKYPHFNNSSHPYRRSTCLQYSHKEKADQFEDVPNINQYVKTAANDGFTQTLINNPYKINTMKLLQLQVDYYRLAGMNVPLTLNETQWEALMQCTSKKAMKTLLKKYHLKDTLKRNYNEIKQIKLKERELNEDKHKSEPINLATSGPTVYGLHRCSLFLKIYDDKIERICDFKLMLTSLFAPVIFIDCGYESFMTPKEIEKVACHIRRMFTYNRNHFFPANLLFCSLLPNTLLMSKLHQRLPKIVQPDYPFFFTTKNYLELYPKERLVYLSPDARNYLHEYCANDVYIIGALATTPDEPLSKARAIRQGVRMAKLPITKETLLNQNGRKSLNLHEVLRILNDLRTPDRKHHVKNNGKNVAFGEPNMKRDASTNLEVIPFLTDFTERCSRKYIYNRLLSESKRKEKFNSGSNENYEE